MTPITKKKRRANRKGLEAITEAASNADEGNPEPLLLVGTPTPILLEPPLIPLVPGEGIDLNKERK